MAIKDKLQGLLGKVTGKDIIGDNVEEVIADAEAKYEGGGSGGSTVYIFNYEDDNNYVQDSDHILKDEVYTELVNAIIDTKTIKIVYGDVVYTAIKIADLSDDINQIVLSIYSSNPESFSINVQTKQIYPNTAE